MDNPEEKPLSLLSYCSGYGGLELGLELAGLRVGRSIYVERECYAAAVVVKAIEAGALAPGIVHTDLTTFPAEIFRGCFDGMVGGYPCQPFSTAGRRQGSEDSGGRHLWPYFKRTIELVRPGFCFFENVEGHVTLGLKDVCHDLGELGYEYSGGLFSAAECGAPHSRKRIFILARQSPQLGNPKSNFSGHGETFSKSPCGDLFSRSGQELGNPSSEGLQREYSPGKSNQEGRQKQNGRVPSATSGVRPDDQLANPNSGGRLKDTITSQLRAAGPFKSSGYCWPSRPGQAQQEWEAPRLVGNPNSDGGFDECEQDPGKEEHSGSCNSGSLVNSPGEGLPLGESGAPPGSREEQKPQRPDGKGKCETVPGLGSPIDGSHGLAFPASDYMGPGENRIDRLRMLGNGVIAHTAAKAFISLWNELEG